MVKFATWMPQFDSLTPALLDLFISTDSCIHSAMAFPAMGKSNHVVFSVSCPVSLHRL